jgi:hypothetical protein
MVLEHFLEMKKRDGPVPNVEELSVFIKDIAIVAGERIN